MKPRVPKNTLYARSTRGGNCGVGGPISTAGAATAESAAADATAGVGALAVPSVAAEAASTSGTDGEMDAVSGAVMIGRGSLRRGTRRGFGFVAAGDWVAGGGGCSTSGAGGGGICSSVAVRTVASGASLSSTGQNVQARCSS